MIRTLTRVLFFPPVLTQEPPVPAGPQQHVADPGRTRLCSAPLLLARPTGGCAGADFYCHPSISQALLSIGFDLRLIFPRLKKKEVLNATYVVFGEELNVER